MRNITPSTHPKALARNARDEEFMRLYRAALAQFIKCRSPQPKRDAVRWVISNGHPLYHVSYERAYRVVCGILHSGKLPFRPSLQGQMWLEISQHVHNLVQHGKMSVAQAVEFVLEHCRASRFFITEQYAYNTIVGEYKYRKPAPRRYHTT